MAKTGASQLKNSCPTAGKVSDQYDTGVLSRFIKEVDESFRVLLEHSEMFGSSFRIYPSECDRVLKDIEALEELLMNSCAVLKDGSFSNNCLNMDCYKLLALYNNAWELAQRLTRLIMRYRVICLETDSSKMELHNSVQRELAHMMKACATAEQEGARILQATDLLDWSQVHVNEYCH